MTSNTNYHPDIEPEDDAEAFRMRVSDRLQGKVYCDWVQDLVDGSLKEVVDAVLAEQASATKKAWASTLNALDPPLERDQATPNRR